MRRFIDGGGSTAEAFGKEFREFMQQCERDGIASVYCRFLGGGSFEYVAPETESEKELLERFGGTVIDGGLDDAHR